jgi:hypothetical protein
MVTNEIAVILFKYDYTRFKGDQHIMESTDKMASRNPVVDSRISSSSLEHQRYAPTPCSGGTSSSQRAA